MGRIINICNHKGGTGKTTICMELCSILGDRGYSVLGIDLDPQRNFSTLSKADISMPTIGDVLKAKVLLEDAIQKADKYDFVASSDTLSTSGNDFTEADDIWLLSDVLAEDKHDFIILDNAPARGPLLTMAYIASDYTIIVTLCEEKCIEGAVKISEDIARLHKRSRDTYKTQLLGYIMTIYEKTNAHKEGYEELCVIGKKYNTSPFETTPRKATKAQDIRKYNISMYEYDRKNKLSQDYVQLTDEILDRIERCEKKQ